jgi:putative transposase
MNAPWRLLSDAVSRNYRFHDPEGLYFVSFATVGWVDVFTRRDYKDIVVDSLRYCQEKKGLLLYAWVIMSNHVHLIIEAAEGSTLPDIMRDLKKYTAGKILQAIERHPGESRKEWMLEIFRKAGASNASNTIYQFWQHDNQPIQLWSPAVIGQKLEYLHANPEVEGYVEHGEDYFYSSAPAFAGKPGLLQLAEL